MKAKMATAALATAVLTGVVGLVATPAYADGDFHANRNMYRVYCAATTDHLYTVDWNEVVNVVNNYGCTYEHIEAYLDAHDDDTVDQDQKDAIYRIYCASSTDHFYTADYRERWNAINVLGCTNEGILGYASRTRVAGTTMLFRLYNPTIDDHLYTTDEEEQKSAFYRQGYKLEGNIGLYVGAAR